TDNRSDEFQKNSPSTELSKLFLGMGTTLRSVSMNADRPAAPFDNVKDRSTQAELYYRSIEFPL
ncbi:MAG: hypothetical protein ABSA22_09175, partial [Acidimicrobiales bacterium]